MSQLRTTGIQQFADKPGDKTPWLSTYGEPMFEWLKHEPEHKKAFDNYMSGKKRGSRRAWFDIYPASERLCGDLALGPPNIVDIGGGMGADMIEFKQKEGERVNLAVVEDLPETLEKVDRGSVPSGVDLLPFDFFKMDQPIRGSIILIPSREALVLTFPKMLGRISCTKSYTTGPMRRLKTYYEELRKR